MTDILAYLNFGRFSIKYPSKLLFILIEATIKEKNMLPWRGYY